MIKFEHSISFQLGTIESIIKMPVHSVKDLAVLKESAQTLLDEFFNLCEQVEHLSHEVNNMLDTVDNIHVPYCCEYLRLAYFQSFMESKEHIDSLNQSMFAFPDEVDALMTLTESDCFDEHTHETVNMQEATLQYFKARFEFIRSVFDEHKSLALKSYDKSKSIPSSCAM